MINIDMIINGKAVQSTSSFEVINPATGKAFAQCATGDAAAVDQAVAAAREAFPTWSSRSMEWRGELLLKLASALQDNHQHLMELVTLESGKPLGGLNGVGSGMELGGSIAWIQYTASLALPVDLIQDDSQARVEVHRKPLGVVASITPWNWPLMIAIWHTIPALFAGNTVLIKPSPFTPVATARFVEIANTILPPGVLNLVTGGPSVGEAISLHQGIDKIVFTGSTATGKRIMASSAGNLKRLTLELGGNDAGIVLPDVNIKEVAPKLFGAIFHNNGQTCACLKRLYLHESIHDEICAELVKLAKSAVVGDGLESGTQIGPVQNHIQLGVVMELAESARVDGGNFLCGGRRMDREGYFYEPTIVTGLRDGHRLVDEEPFGPIIAVIKYTDVDDIIATANGNPNGLGGSIWSADVEKAAALAARLECGTVWVNDHGSIQPNAPFGGVKQSGVGVEFGSYGLEEYTYLQTIKVVRQ